MKPPQTGDKTMTRFFTKEHTDQQFTAVAVKDRILHELSSVENSPINFAKKASFILEVLSLTDGLWNDLSYSYKAGEICRQINETAIRLKRQVEETTNNKPTLKLLDSVLQFSSNQAVAFHRLQSDKLCDIVGVTDAQTREISRMTNEELAS